MDLAFGLERAEPECVILRRRQIILGVAAVVVLAGAVSAYAVYAVHQRGGSTAVGTHGGTVTSDDGTVRVAFGEEDARPGTRVRIDVFEDGPTVPDVLEPIAPMFDVAVTQGSASGGTVSARFDGLAPDVDAAQIVMLIEDRPNEWRMLDTTVDLAAGVATARWPHFSRGMLACLNPFTDFGSLGWGSLKKRAKCAKPNLEKLAGAVTSALLPLVGGTAKNAACDPSGTDWTFADIRTGAGTTVGPVLTGCTGPLDGQGHAWPAKIGNQYPYPMLVSLPKGVSGPGALDLAEDADPAELLVAMGWSLVDKAVVPGGGEVPIRMADNAGDRLTFDGVLDPTTLAVKAVVIAATVVTRGESAELRAAARAEERLFVEQLKAGMDKAGKPYYNSDFAADTGWHSKSARDQRRAAVGNGATALWSYIDLVQCGIAAVKELKDKSYGSAVKELVLKCWPNFVAGIAEYAIGREVDELDPTARVEKVKVLTGELIDNVQDLPRLATGNAAMQLFTLTGGKVDITRATLNATRAAPGAVDPKSFQVFGRSRGNVSAKVDGSAITVSPPLGADRYSALWGIFLPGRSCRTTVELDASLVDPQATGNFGFAIAPRSSLSSDQPVGASIQFEHEASPDFATAGSYVRPAMLPRGAWAIEKPPVPAPDINRPHHVRVAADGRSISIQIDGGAVTRYDSASECGGVTIRVWGAAVSFRDIRIANS